MQLYAYAYAWNGILRHNSKILRLKLSKPADSTDKTFGYFSNIFKLRFCQAISNQNHQRAFNYIHLSRTSKTLIVNRVCVIWSWN